MVTFCFENDFVGRDILAMRLSIFCKIHSGRVTFDNAHKNLGWLFVCSIILHLIPKILYRFKVSACARIFLPSDYYISKTFFTHCSTCGMVQRQAG